MNTSEKNERDLWRGRVAWHMQVKDVIFGNALGFDYPMEGDKKPHFLQNYSVGRGVF